MYKRNSKTTKKNQKFQQNHSDKYKKQSKHFF